ncbi:MAG: AmmeMemoRadiSam system radical SAM enzyme [Candidatus Omnitrophica bacterium]|nr:AmmeMemoRadiSam system radical SAM enzyme [Candidatus Omnitrophota bacterium]MBU4488879.1 AmmeMemoRadiSam system radical SAM enzyme [Candidatus Omnitrophota bacterium]MCG2705467.1 AmmeMemoRadiSam system radical SAM enzyme [Candidatus Omnitrophota bacterium]
MPENISRRDFLKKLARVSLLIYAAPFLGNILGLKGAHAKIGESRGLREAMFYQKLGDKTVQCLLCPRQCILQDGVRSFCKVRENAGGTLKTLVYELPCAVHVDPIEKKPIYHMLPGSLAYSIATAGCNLRCKFCQNWQISQMAPEDTENIKLPCSTVIENAKRSGSISIAYTYSEPTVFYEYAIETAKLARKAGIKNIFKTGGFINAAPLDEICNYLDAANVDLKGFDKKYLGEICSEDLDTVLKGLLIYKRKGVWLEITNLVVPTLNDDMGTIKKMCVWIKDNLGGDVPLHFSRFWPTYKLKNLYPTPIETLIEARDTAMSVGLNFVYIGNIPDDPSNNTYCPSCKRLLIERKGYFIAQNNIVNSSCRYCSKKIPGIWELPKYQKNPRAAHSAVSKLMG